MPTVELPVEEFRAFLNTVLIFVNRGKMTLAPQYNTMYVLGDTATVYNGETGATVTAPVKFTETAMRISPFEMARLVNNLGDETTIVVTVNEEEKYWELQTKYYKAKFQGLKTSEYDYPLEGLDQPQDIVSIGYFLDKVRRAKFSITENALTPIMMGIKVAKDATYSTDNKRIYLEAGESNREFLVPYLLGEHILSIRQEPLKIVLTESQIILWYNGLIVRGQRLSEESKYPDLSKFIATAVSEENEAVVEYDKDLLNKKLEVLMLLSTDESKTVSVQCRELDTLVISLSEKDDQEGSISIPCKSSAVFEPLNVRGQFILDACYRYSTLLVKSTRTKLIFTDDRSFHLVSVKRVA